MRVSSSLFRLSSCSTTHSGSPANLSPSSFRVASWDDALKVRSQVRAAHMSDRDLPVPVGLSRMPIWPLPACRTLYTVFMKSVWTSYGVKGWWKSRTPSSVSSRGGTVRSDVAMLVPFDVCSRDALGLPGRG